MKKFWLHILVFANLIAAPGCMSMYQVQVHNDMYDAVVMEQVIGGGLLTAPAREILRAGRGYVGLWKASPVVAAGATLWDGLTVGGVYAAGYSAGHDHAKSEGH